MATDNQTIRFYLLTHSPFSHNVLTGMLTANDIQYHWDYVQNEEVYSKFVVIGDINQYNLIKEFTQENNGASISLEYGAF